MISQVLSSLLIAAFVGATSSSVINTHPFDSSLFKDVNVTRGLQYHYYAAPAEPGKPTLLFLHGFPSTSYDWRHQVSFFQDNGYGLIVPDMLGYGGTSKPLDPELYVSSLVTKDIVDILDAEGIDKAVVVGHDWYNHKVFFRECPNR
jgi:soluble epoxide hydrolase / lipid-phosphate phosphatase